MDALPHTKPEELQQQIDDLEAAEESRKKEQKAADKSRADEQRAAAEQIQQQLQQVTGAAISTMGSIEQAKAVLADQMRERYQLEGMLRATMAQR